MTLIGHDFLKNNNGIISYNQTGILFQLNNKTIPTLGTNNQNQQSNTFLLSSPIASKTHQFTGSQNEQPLQSHLATLSIFTDTREKTLNEFNTFTNNVNKTQTCNAGISSGNLGG